MLTKEITTDASFTVNAQLAVEFVKVANRYCADIRLERDNHNVNGKSLMSLMELASRQGNDITLLAEGADAPLAMVELGNLLEQGKSNVEY